MKNRFSLVELMIVFLIVGMLFPIGIFAADREVFNVTELHVGTSAQQVSGTSTSLLEGLLTSKTKVAGTSTATYAVGTSGGTACTNSISIQIKDLSGVNMATKTAANVWFSDTAAAASATGTIASVTATTGALADTIKAQASYIAISDTNGVIALRMVSGSDGYTNFCNVAIGGAVVSTTCVVTNIP